jgi:hypothetical protein
MLKRILIAAAMTGAVAAIAVPVQVDTAEARPGCFAAARAAVPGFSLATFKQRREFRKACRAQNKAQKAMSKAAKA